MSVECGCLVGEEGKGMQRKARPPDDHKARKCMWLGRLQFGHVATCNLGPVDRPALLLLNCYLPWKMENEPSPQVPPTLNLTRVTLQGVKVSSINYGW